MSGERKYAVYDATALYDKREVKAVRRNIASLESARNIAQDNGDGVIYIYTPDGQQMINPQFVEYVVGGRSKNGRGRSEARANNGILVRVFSGVQPGRLWGRLERLRNLVGRERS